MIETEGQEKHLEDYGNQICETLKGLWTDPILPAVIKLRVGILLAKALDECTRISQLYHLRKNNGNDTTKP